MKQFIVYDFRALENTDDASLLCVEDTLKEAIESAKDYGGGVVYSYDINGDNLINEQFEKSVEGEK